MKVSLNIAEFAAIRNSLARRHEDLKDLIAEWADDDRMNEQRERAEEEDSVILALDEKLLKARQQ